PRDLAARGIEREDRFSEVDDESARHRGVADEVATDRKKLELLALRVDLLAPVGGLGHVGELDPLRELSRRASARDSTDPARVVERARHDVGIFGFLGEFLGRLDESVGALELLIRDELRESACEYRVFPLGERSDENLHSLETRDFVRIALENLDRIEPG